MTTYAFMNVFQGSSGLAEDQIVNVTHWYRAAGAPVTDFDNVRDMLKDFYTVAPTGNPIRTYMSGQLQLTAKVKAYDLSQPKPRAPVYESTYAISGFGGGSPLPNEVALCLSFEAKRESGELQARRRNRIYLGPFASGAMGTTGRPSPVVLTDVLNAAKRLKDAQAASATWDWMVYSPLNDEVLDIQHIWVDDAWDTQRRRGLSPSSRTQIYY